MDVPLFCVFTFLVCDSAACFASGLAGGLAFAAATLRSGFLEVCLVKRLDMFHAKNSLCIQPFWIYCYYNISDSFFQPLQ